MTPRSRSQLMVALAFGLFVAITVWHYQDMRAAQDAVEVARKNLIHCQDLAQRIRDVQQRPTMAALEETSITTLATLVQSAADRSRIPRDAVVRIDPQPSRRIGETDYTEQATLVELRAISLQQLVQLLHTLLSEQSELDVSTVRLTAPRYEAAESKTDPVETWVVEVTLTYLIFSPRVAVPT